MKEPKKLKYKKRAYTKSIKNNENVKDTEHQNSDKNTNVNFFQKYKEQISLFVLFSLFIGIASRGLGQFFTTDETAWYYNWVREYWAAYSSGNLLGTNLTTYPGSLHSFLCGITNFFLDQKDFLTYDKVEVYLFWWRFPILLFNAISLIGIFYLLKKFFSPIQSFVAVFLMAFSPYIIGMSRIVNPDSLLWSTSLISILSYIIFIREQKNKYLIISGIFMGMALASKYNAILLFVFMPITIIFEFLFDKISKEQLKLTVFKTLVIWIIAIAIFSFFLPAVIVKPSIYYGRVFQYFITSPVFISIIIFVVIDTYLLNSKILYFVKEKIFATKVLIKTLPILFIVFILIGLIIRAFNIELDSWDTPNEQWKIPITKAFYLNIWEYFISQQIAIVVGFVVFALISLLPKSKKLDFSIPLLMLAFIYIFIMGAVVKGVRGSGHRYGIMLYPFAIMIAVWSFSFFKKKHIIFALIALLSVIELSFVFPKYYIFYQNRRYFTTGQKINSWAIGGYDLAQEFNKSSEAEITKVYADRYSFKHFSKGYTENITTDTRASKIKEFDYLCLSKSGISQVPMSPPLKYYYEMPQDSFEYFVGDKDNYWMGLIKVDKNKKELKIENTFDPEFYIDQSQSFTISLWESHDTKNSGELIYIDKNYKNGIEFRIKNNTLHIKYGENETFKSKKLDKNKYNNIVIQHINKGETQKLILWINAKKIIDKKIKKTKSKKSKFFIATDFKGFSNDVRIYLSELTEDQVKVIYNNGEMIQDLELESQGEVFKPIQHFTHKKE